MGLDCHQFTDVFSYGLGWVLHPDGRFIILRHFYCPVGSFIQFYLCVGSVFALFNRVGWSLVDMFRGVVR